MASVRVPGSTANIGAGFDALALAINRYVWASTDGPIGPRAPAEPCDAAHIARKAFEAAGGSGMLWFDFNLRPGRGMGFSAAARIAGAYLGALHQGAAPGEARRESYTLTAAIEGHGDNAAASAYGGICVVAPGAPDPLTLQATLPGELLLWVPGEQALTDRSRAALSPMVERGDAVRNIGSVAAFVAGLYEHRSEWITVGTQDFLHQTQRWPSLPHSEQAYLAALEAGALAAWLSGSGPSVAVLTSKDRAEAVAAALPEGGGVVWLSLDRSGLVSLDEDR